MSSSFPGDLGASDPRRMEHPTGNRPAASSSAMPSDAPPPYSRVDPTRHKTRNGIPPDRRRSMEDESRPLPEGWVRQYDSNSQHQFFVDTRSKPPRSIWHHPYDDDDFLNSLPSAERERVESLHRVPTPADVIAESSDEDDHHDGAKLPPRRQDSHPNGVQRFGRKLKDKMTHTTHQQREADRKKRADDEQRAYETHLAFRRAMQRSIETGQPQLVGKDRQGKDVYVSPPQGMQTSQYGANARYTNPYGQGMYAAPNSAYYPPGYAYSRPYGYGYGGGLGLPILGGLGGGLLLGGMMGGFGL